MSYTQYKNRCATDLRNISKTNTKAFWNTLHKYLNPRKKNPDIDIETFFEYFKNLNYTEIVDDDVEFDLNDICDNDVYDELLNRVITELEICEAIKDLKNNKAPGLDRIVNEYLKNSPPILISLYCKLFNVVLDTGIIPTSWTSGIIKPVFKKQG